MKTSQPYLIKAFLFLLLFNMSCRLMMPVEKSNIQVTQQSSSSSTKIPSPEVTSTSALPADIWSRRDVAPSDVIEQIQIASPGGAGGGGDPCVEYFFNQAELTRLQAVILGSGIPNQIGNGIPNKIRINQEVNLCAVGVSLGETLKITITDPSGDTKTLSSTDMYIGERTDNQNRSFILFEGRNFDITKPGSLLGEYKIDIHSQNGLTEIDFSMLPANYPNAGGIDGRNIFGGGISVNAGEPILLPLAGFLPHESLTFNLYKFKSGTPAHPNQEGCPPCTEEVMDFVTSWTSETDDRGELIETLNTDLNTPKTSYLILISGSNAPKCEFDSPFFTNKGFDWNSIKCDIPISIGIR